MSSHEGLRRVEASPETLMKHAGYTAEIYLIDAIERIDMQLGEGFAKKHPELIGQYMLTAALDYHAASVQISGQRVEDGLESIAGTGSVGDVQDALESIASAISGALGGVASQIEAVATIMDR